MNNKIKKTLRFTPHFSVGFVWFFGCSKCLHPRTKVRGFRHRHFDIKKSVFAVILLSLVFLTGCTPIEPVEDDIYTVGRILHNVNNATNTSLVLSQNQFATYKFTKDFPGKAPVLFYEYFYFISPEAGFAAAVTNPAVSKFTKIVHAYGNDSALANYPRNFSLYHAAGITYFNYSGFEEENLSLSGLEATSADPFNSIAPIPSETKEFVFGGPYLPGSVFFDPQSLKLGIIGELLTSNKTVISLKTDFVPQGTELPNYTISVNGSVVDSNTFIDSWGSWNKNIFYYYPSINGTYEIVLNLPSYYPLFKKSTVRANFVYAGQPVDIPWLSGIEISKRFTPISVIPILVEASSLNNFSAINVSYNNASGNWTQIALAFLGTANATCSVGPGQVCKISAQGSIPVINQPLNLLIELGTPSASQSYLLESVSLPQESLTAVVNLETPTISPGTLVSVSGSVRDPSNKGVGNLLIRTFVNGQEIKKSFTSSLMQFAPNNNTGNFSFRFDAPLGLTNGSNLSFKFGEAGVYPERTVNLFGAGQVFGYDFAVLGLDYPVPLVIGVNNSIGVNISNVGTNSASGILELYYVESNSLGLEFGPRILVESRPVSLLTGEIRVENFSSMLNAYNYNINNIKLIAKINLTNGTDQNIYNNERAVVRPIFVDRDVSLIINKAGPFIVNESGNMTLRIRNNGFQTLSNISYQLEYRRDLTGENFSLASSGILESLAPGVFEDIELELNLTELITYQIKATANVSDDRISGNNDDSIFVAPMFRGADLSAFVYAQNLIAGVESQFQVTVYNGGIEEAQNPEIEVSYQDGFCSFNPLPFQPGCNNLILISAGPLPNLASFSNANYEFNFTPPNSGAITMVVVLNATNEIMPEDNIRDFGLFVSGPGPDVLVQNLFTYSQIFVVNYSSNVSATIRNIGNIEASQVAGALSWANSKDASSETFNTIATANLGVIGPSQEKIMSALFAPPVKGKLILRANVSDENDTNPNNNEFSDAIAVFNNGSDVGVTSIYVDNLIVGQNNDVAVRLTNFWNESAENISVSLFENNTFIGTQVISASGGGTLGGGAGGGGGGGPVGGGLGGYFGTGSASFNYIPQSPGEKELIAIANFSGDIDLSDNVLSINLTAYNLINVTFNATNSSGSPSGVFLISDIEQVQATQIPVVLTLLEGRDLILLKTTDINNFQDYAYRLDIINASFNNSESIVTDYYENLSDGSAEYHAALANKPSFPFKIGFTGLGLVREYANSIGIGNDVLNLQVFSSCGNFDFSSKSCSVSWEEQETVIDSENDRVTFILNNNSGNEFEGIAISTSNETLISWPFIENLFDTILFFNFIDFSRILSNVSLQQYIVLEQARINIDTTVLPELGNEPARLTFKNIQFVNPLATYNGGICPSNVCSNINYNQQANIFGVTVTGFSEFEVVEGPYCGDNICQANAAETCSSCVADCGSCTGPGGGAGGGGGGGGVSCTPRWNCDWGPCSENSQRFICVDERGCGNRINKPREITRLCFSEGNCVDNDNDGYGIGIDCLGLDIDDADPAINIITDDSDQTEPDEIELGIVFWFTTVVLLAAILIILLILLKTMKGHKTINSLESISSSKRSSESWPVESS